MLQLHQQEGVVTFLWFYCQDPDEDREALQGPFHSSAFYLSYHQVYFHMNYKLIEITYGKIFLMYSEYL